MDKIALILEPEKSTQDELEEELERFIASGKSVTVDDCGTYKVSYHDFKKVARHFAEWQKEQDNYDIIFHKGMMYYRKQMMEEAVEGVIEEVSFNNGEQHNTIRFSFDEESLHVENRIWMPRCGKDGDKVRIIIVKEE